MVWHAIFLNRIRCKKVDEKQTSYEEALKPIEKLEQEPEKKAKKKSSKAKPKAKADESESKK